MKLVGEVRTKDTLLIIKAPEMFELLQDQVKAFAEKEVNVFKAYQIEWLMKARKLIAEIEGEDEN